MLLDPPMRRTEPLGMKSCENALARLISITVNNPELLYCPPDCDEKEKVCVQVYQNLVAVMHGRNRSP